jgi:hypothetical protein
MLSFNTETLTSQICFRSPMTVMIAGPSQSGKTMLLISILKNMHALIDKPPKRIVYCYGVQQEAFNLLSDLNIEFKQGLPDVEELDPSINNMVILDDLMSSCENDKSIQNLFCVHSHHRNISVIFLTQVLLN